MSLNEFLGALKVLEDQLKAGAGSVLSTIDRLSYGMLVDCLKSEDPDAIKEAIDQLAREKRPIAIPPLYLVSVAHPVPWVRAQATKGLEKLIKPEELKKFTDGHSTKEAVSALITEFGHYRRL